MNDLLRVLVADDEIIIRRKVCMMLKGRFALHEASTASAVREVLDRDFDAVLLDIVFPDGNGIDLCRELKEHSPHRTVIMSSSMESVDAWHQAFQAGADGYLEKRELLGLDPQKIELMIANLVERNNLRRRLEETNRRQAELLSVLSHDVRAPFQALLGTIEALRKSSNAEEGARNVETLHRCATDQLAFINSLLEYLRLESGVSRLRTMPTDLNLPVNQSLQTTRTLRLEKAVELETALGSDLPPVMADLGRVCQLMNNLVTNAIKFTPRGGKIVVTTAPAQRDGAPGVEIRVEDTGVGIDPAEREKIFQRFRRGRGRGTEGETGTGLGLSICKEIVQLHGGSLEAHPREPKGSAFVAWFPAGINAARAGEANPEREPRAGFSVQCHREMAAAP